MSVEITEYDEGRSLEVVATGKLQKEDYEEFLPLFEKRLEDFEKIGVLFVMKGFDGFEMWALWEDIKLNFNHYDDIRRLAMVGENDWQDWMSNFCKPFLKSEVEYFSEEDFEKARAWVREPVD